MAKQIILKDKDGNEYTLEFNRKTVERMERNGFVVDTDRPYTMITQLFNGAFQMHHRKIDADRVQRIWDEQTKKDDLLQALVQMYMEPITSLMQDPEGEDENPTWKMV